MSWKQQAEEVAEGNFLKWKDGTKRTVIFLDPPLQREFKTKEGEIKRSMEFTVIVDGVDRVMSVSSKRLLNLIISENDDAGDLAPEIDPDDWYLRDKSYMIKAIGDGMARQWQIKEVPSVASVPKKPAKAPRQEEEEEEEEEKPRTRKRKDTDFSEPEETKIPADTKTKCDKCGADLVGHGSAQTKEGTLCMECFYARVNRDKEGKDGRKMKPADLLKPESEEEAKEEKPKTRRRKKKEEPQEEDNGVL